MTDPAGRVTVAELAGALIAVFEGCRLTAYQDPGGVWTIGYGHTGPEVVKGFRITQERAETLLVMDQAALLKKLAGRPLLEAAALVSFGYNCGPGALDRVLGGHALVQDFVHDKTGKTLDGLVRRRRLEETLILVSQQRP